MYIYLSDKLKIYNFGGIRSILNIILSLCNNYDWKLLFKYLVKIICIQNKSLCKYLLIKTYYRVIIKTHPFYIEYNNEPYNIITQ